MPSDAKCRSRNDDKMYASESKRLIHKASGCRVDGEGVNREVNVQNMGTVVVDGL